MGKKIFGIAGPLLLLVYFYFRHSGLPSFDAAGNRYPFLASMAVFSVNDRVHHLGAVSFRNILTGS